MIIADLHIHSKYSRGCSKDLDLDNLVKWAKIKGLNLLGTGDFMHPLWIEELKTLEEKNGILYKGDFPFILQTEVSLIYTQDGKGRRVHLLILAPSIDVANKITEYFKGFGRVDYDGRPIFKIPSYDLVKDLRKIDTMIEIIPAHIWTPHFSVFGEYNQFNSLKECFKDQTEYINAIETGISSDPEMNRRVSDLDNINMVSFSDAHSYWPWRLGREATLFDCDVSYDSIIKAIRTGKGLKGTIEADPSYGKYHFDGHRKCGVVMDPKASLHKNQICPVCRKKLTVGVASRVEELADREEGKDEFYYTLIPLHEIIAKHLDKGISTKAVWEVYDSLIERFGNEFEILLNAKKADLLEVVDEKLVGYILKNRKGKILVQPGFDGEYGTLVFEDKDKRVVEKKSNPQTGLEEF